MEGEGVRMDTGERRGEEGGGKGEGQGRRRVIMQLAVGGYAMVD